MHISSVDHGPEVSPAEKCSDLSMPQFSTVHNGIAATQSSKDLYMNSPLNTNAINDGSRKRRKFLTRIIIAAIAIVTIAVLVIALPLSLIHHHKSSR